MKKGKKKTSNVFLGKKIMALCIMLMMTSVSLFTVITTADEINDRDYFYVLFDGLPSFEKREQLSEIMEFHRYLGSGRFVCEFPVNLVDVISSDPSVIEVELIKPADKTSLGLRRNLPGNIDLVIIPYEIEDVSTVAKEIKAMDGRITRTQATGIPRVWANINVSLIDKVANIKEIYHIEADFDKTNFLDKITTITYMGMDAAQAGGFAGNGIMGEVQDNGCQMTHPDFDVDYYDGPVSVDAHGTCTYGIVFSLGTNDINAQGTLYDAVSVFADYNVQTQYNSISRLWKGQFSSGNAGQNGLFQSNSWGYAPMDGQYWSYASEADSASHDFPNVLVFWAAGNSNSGVYKGSLSRIATCKNGLTVGAVWHKNTADMSDDDWHSGGVGNTPSQGPCADDRQKPDLVGPFDWIYCTDMIGSGGYAMGNYYSNFGGTSGATPCVAGIAGQTYEMYIENYFGNNPSGNIPSSAMIKAILIADAYQYPFAQTDRDSQGWGSADAEQIYNLGANYHVLEDGKSVAEGGSWSRQAHSDGTMPLKITLAWNDPPAPGSTGSGRALRNNLDLKVTGPDDTIWYGNNGLYDNHYSTSGTGINHWSLSSDHRDDLNNVENVFIQNPMEGTYTIEVFGRSGDMYSSPQAFAVAAAGAQDFVLNLIDFPMYEAESDPGYNEMCGPAVAQMVLNYLWWNMSQDPEPPMMYTQDELYNSGMENNSNLTIPYFDTQGMWHTIQYLDPGPYSEYGYNFNKRYSTDSDYMLKIICQWINYTVGTVSGGYKEGHPPQVPSVVPTYGNYSNWMAIRGFHSNKPAYPLPDELSIYGFWVNDPYPSSLGGIGENSYKTIDEWLATYYLPLSSNDYYNGKYVAIVEPPDENLITQITKMHSPNRLTKAETDFVKSVMKIYPTEEKIPYQIKTTINNWIVRAAIKGVSEELLPYDPDFKAIFDRTIPGEPLFVNDYRGEDYYLVPFNIRDTRDELSKYALTRETVVVVIVDAEDGHLKEASWTDIPMKYLPISKADAKYIIYKTLYESGIDLKYVENTPAELVHRQSTPYYPDWKIIFKDRVYYVSQDGTISNE